MESNRFFTFEQLAQYLSRPMTDKDLWGFVRQLGSVTQKEDSSPRSEDPNFTTYLDVDSAGVSFGFRGESLYHIAIFFVPSHEFQAFTGSLAGITGATQRNQIHALIGQPIQTRPPARDLILGNLPASERFELNDLWIHIEYSEQETVSAIRLGRRDI